MTWHTVIGLEVHIQLLTQSKIFSSTSTTFGAPANTRASIIDFGLPGTLPALNREVIRMAILFGLSVDATIEERCVFSRKHYFYPDLPKGYQISQYEHPIVSNGQLTIALPDHPDKVIRITRAHLEEDAGKSIHDGGSGSGVDLNRAGQPLLEIVSEPDIRSAQEAIAYLKTLRTLVRYLGICDGNMQEGSFRCDANISLRKTESDPFGTKVEIKNLNSFKFIEKSIEYEQKRQSELLENNQAVLQQTRLYDEKQNVTRATRTKENADDYRYFDDPDLPSLHITSQEVSDIQKTMPELPWEKQQRFEEQYQLSSYDAGILVSESNLADYFEAVLASDNSLPAKSVANWVIGEILSYLRQDSLPIEQCPISPQKLGNLIQRIEDHTLSITMAKSLFSSLWNSDTSVDQLIDEHDLRLISDSNILDKLIEETLKNNPDQVKQFLAGKDKVFGFFVGQLMKKTQGKADPSTLQKQLKSALTHLKNHTT